MTKQDLSIKAADFAKSRAVRMKDTPADTAVSDKVFRAARTELDGYFTEIEHARDQKSSYADQEKAVFAAAKAKGYDTKAMRTVLKIRKDPNARDAMSEHNAIVDLYLDTTT